MELGALIRLFRRVHGEAHPVAGVYSVDCWRRLCGRRLVSLVVVADDELVAHIGLYRTSPRSPDVAVAFASVDPAYERHLGDITALLRGAVRRLAITQRLGACLGVIDEETPLLSAFLEGVLRPREVAILPGFVTPPVSRGARPDGHMPEAGRTHGLVVHRLFGPDRLAGTPVFVPEHHREMTRLLYAPLGLERRIGTAETPASPERLSQRRPVERFAVRAHGCHHLFVEPDLFNPAAALEPRSWDGVTPIYLYLNALHPTCPAVAEAVENQGYRFAGILPLINGRDSLVYFKESEAYVDRTPFAQARARMVSRYIEGYDLSAALDVVVPKERIVLVRNREDLSPSAEGALRGERSVLSRPLAVRAH